MTGLLAAVCRVHALLPDRGIGVTAIDKRSVTIGVRVSKYGLFGDVQADRGHHGGVDQAVYAYAGEDAGWFARELGRGVPPGLFGENLTTRGVDVTGAVIGERWRVGERLVLEATAPRTPCGTFERRMAVDGSQDRFREHGAPGCYFRVLRAGVIRQGDAMRSSSAPSTGSTVGGWFRRQHPDDAAALLDRTPRARCGCTSTCASSPSARSGSPPAPERPARSPGGAASRWKDEAMISAFTPDGIPEVEVGTDLVALIADAVGALEDGDLVVVSSKIVSKAEGRQVRADDREQAITDETVRVVATRRQPTGALTRIVENRLGIVGAAAGVDASNVAEGTVLLLPEDPDASAARLRAGLAERFGVRLGVVVTDTLGRPWRTGQIDVAIGAAGVAVVDDLRGTPDATGRRMDVTVVAVADEIASMADLVKGKTANRPVAVVRGLGAFVIDEDGPGARSLVRVGPEDMFRRGTDEAYADGYREGYAEGSRESTGWLGDNERGDAS